MSESNRSHTESFQVIDGPVTLASANQAPAARPLDRLDAMLLEMLQADGRATFSEMGARVGLKPSTVHERVKRMEADGVIVRYAALIDARAVGIGFGAFLTCHVAGAGRDFLKTVSIMPEVCEVHRVTGEDSFMLRVMARSAAHLDELVSRIKLAPELIRTKATVVLATPFERPGFSIPEIVSEHRRTLRSVG
jgi:Lrp/AsnC family transcriptional regulator, leucine-responsive regulatory protein